MPIRTALSLQEISRRHSAACFLNSFLREWPRHEFQETPAVLRARTDHSLCLRINGLPGPTYWLPISYRSLTGRHRYGSSFFRISSHEDSPEYSIETLGFNELVQSLTRDLAAVLDFDSESVHRFVSRIESSAANIEVALTQRTDLAALGEKPLHFLQAEQALLIGHSFHPNPKSRDEFSFDDFQKYSPETASAFSIHWFLAQPTLLHVERAASFTDQNVFTDMLFAAFPERTDLKAQLENGFIPFPVHPWQRQYLMRKDVVKEALTRGDLLDLGPSADQWHATSSVRSLYNPDSKYMLKFSLSVRLTNSVRHLQAVEVVRGLQVTDVLATKAGQQFLSENPEFVVLNEPAFMALKGSDGELLTDSVVVWRENPFRHSAASSEAVVLATLTQDAPLGTGLNLIQNLIKKAAIAHGFSVYSMSLIWFDCYFKSVVLPLFRSQAHYGILMGAHQQNVIVKLKDHLPAGSWFRDCQGTGYTAHGHELYAGEVALLNESNGNILPDRQASYLFVYYLIINATFGVISAIGSIPPGHEPFAEEEELMEMLRAQLTELLASAPKDRFCLEYLLFEKQIMQKGNFFCSLKSINENTSTDPLAIYNPIANPLYRSPESTQEGLKP